jgi:glucose-6-phosphate 1-dehydrogenase
MVIFGASGDLTKRKLIPALYELFLDKQLPKCFRIVGFARSENSAEEFRSHLRDSVREFGRKVFDEKEWAKFAEIIDYHQGDYTDPAAYASLKKRLEEMECGCSVGDNRLFYLATPPSLYETVIGNLHGEKLVYPKKETDSWSRVIIEKPFGRDLDSARELNSFVRARLHENQIYRIDHYLGKETVQNILVFRFANAIFEPLWNRNHIDHVQITAAEKIGVEGRGSFYDEAGVIRDFLQNHLFEVMSLIAMEQPVSFQADPIRDEKVKVLRSLHRQFDDEIAENVVAGRYDGYLDVKGVKPDSRTPTYAALKVMIDNWRWQGVPFYLRAGKSLVSRVTEVNIHFRRIPFCLFGQEEVCQRLEPNVLTIRIQPDEGIRLRFGCKTPGDNLAVSPVLMDFNYAEAFGRETPEAYARLLIDAMRGDQTLFSRSDAVEHAWTYITPILRKLESGLPLHGYKTGSDGPVEAAQLLGKDGRAWDRIVPDKL